MTVNYSLDVSTSSFFCLYRLLFRWRGSVWKSVWTELATWLAVYSCLSFTYRMMLDKEQRAIFEDLCIFFYAYSDYIPITFMLGFYVSTVFTRWWDVFMNIGWVDSPMLLVSCLIRGADVRARIIRRNIMRYLVLTQALVFRDISASVKKRFPTVQHLVTAGLMTEAEMKVFEAVESPHAKYWQPMHWAFCLCRCSREEGLISSDILLMDLLDKLRQFRVNVMNLTMYDWVPVPLVYTQVVHIAIRTYFFLAIFGRQYIDLSARDQAAMPKTIDIYIPIMTILQFICFVGWMKVAEVLLNPLGEDDDDFECNWILDRNLQVAFSVVDDAYGKFPPDAKDPWWETSHPEPLYTAESAARPPNPQMGSCKFMPTEDDDYMVRPHIRINANNNEPKMMWDELDGDDIVPIERRNHQKNENENGSIDYLNRLSEKKLGALSRLRRHSGLGPQLPKQRRGSSASTATPRKKRSMSSMFMNDWATTGKQPPPSSRHSSFSSLNCHDGLTISPSIPNGHLPSPDLGYNEERPRSPNAWMIDENRMPVITEEEMRRRDSRSSYPDIQCRRWWSAHPFLLIPVQTRARRVLAVTIAGVTGK
ncbi:unnamed protein product, partial [Mesorhabditis belari]|uniref:Bestrophin homolog n=1 Tax=Mesorhabditis belari TaxID=2138241 RepID=A0AAF3J4F2_9BILA